jgi:response regulator NasT
VTAAAPTNIRSAVDLDRPRRVLVADDEHLVATDLAMTLGELGYLVLGPAVDGEAAVDLAQITHPDLALLDIRMPKRDGLTAASQIYHDLGVPVIILSAYSDSTAVAAAQEAGVFGYLVKPASANQLRAAIDVAWGRFVDSLRDQEEIAALERKIEDRRIIERAKWILVQRRQLTEEEAMRTLQRQARQSRKKMAEVAQLLIDASELL